MLNPKSKISHFFFVILLLVTILESIPVTLLFLTGAVFNDIGPAYLSLIYVLIPPAFILAIIIASIVYKKGKGTLGLVLFLILSILPIWAWYFFK